MKNNSYDFAKLSRPTLLKVFERKRLFSMLEDAFNSPVIWITGPPGCGKTTLVSSYIETRGLPCLWYQVDEGDTDPATFFHYMSLAAKKAAPRSRKSLPIFSPEYIPALPVFTLRFFEQLFNKLKRSTFLVFDNYHELPEDDYFHELMRKGLSNVPNGLNILIISRSTPPKALTYLLANNIMKIIRSDDLKLTFKEAKKIVQMRTDQEFSENTIRRIHQITDGWVSGLTLWLEAERMHYPIFPKKEYETPEEIFDYFSGEIFERTDSKTKEFLLKTAFLPKMNIAMANRITGVSKAKEILSRVCRNNYFIAKYRNPRVSYQYHPLFREFLLARAKEYFSINDQSKLRLASARLLEEAREFEEAAKLFMADKDHDSLTCLIMTQAPALLEQGRNSIVLEWLESLPEKVVSGMPWLIFWKGACLLPLEPENSRVCFEQSFKAFKSQGDTAGKLLSWSGVIDAIIMSFGSFKAFDPWIDIFEQIRKEFESFPVPEIKTRVAGGMFKALVLRQTHHPDIEKWASLSMLPGDNPATLNYNSLILCHLHGYHASYKFDFDKAEDILKKLHAIENQSFVSPIAKILVRFSEISYYEFKGMIKECFDAADKYTEFVGKTGLQLFDGLISVYKLAVFLDTNDEKNAKVLLDKMATSLDKMKLWEKWIYYLQKARFALIQKDFIQADTVSNDCIELIEDIGSPVGKLACMPLKIYALYGLGDTLKTNHMLKTYLELSEKLISPKDKFMGLLAKAYIYLDSGKDAEGFKTLRQGLAIGKKHTLLNVFSDQPAVTAFLCVKALEEDIEVDYVQTIIKKRKLVPQEPPVHIENWPWPLKVFTLGGFELERNGSPIKFTGKVQQKPLAMLKVIIAMGSKQVHENRIADALWPDTDGYRARKAFATTLHRLRKLLGIPEAITIADRRVTLGRNYFWVDAWAFKRLIEKADALPWHHSKTDDFQKMIMAQKAVDLYKGDFLSGEDWEPGIIAAMGSLQDLFLKGVLMAGQYFEDAGQWEKALECYQKALDKNILTEELVARLIFCHQVLGQLTQARAVYKRCKNILIKTQGMDTLSAFTSMLKFPDSN